MSTDIIDAKPTVNDISEANWSSSPVGDDARISSGFGVDRNIGSSPHKGVDYAVPVGTEVRATADGIVSRAYFSRSYGNTVIINHGISPNGGGNVYTLYAHGNNLNVSAGQSVSLGDLIFNSGATGSAASGAHLHYEVIRTLFSPNSSSFFSGFNLRHLPGSLGGLLGF
jgi:murein DD-endopeptidase MepM/ murein hydrolase activator NlpD